MKAIANSELIINKDGSIFHLHLKPENLAKNIILVGDPDRVKTVADFFDKKLFEVKNREFHTKTGEISGKKFSVISTGIGTDNIDIVLNELDALVNIDLNTRKIKEKKISLNIVRIGTSGSLQKELEIDKPVASQTAIGFDGLLNFYKKRDEVCELEIEKNFVETINFDKRLAAPYFVNSSPELLEKIGFDMLQGFTISAPGFYGPQGRVLRLEINDKDINEKISAYRWEERKIMNYEMECSAIYGLSKLMGHNALTVCNIIANRISKQYSKDYKSGVKKLIETVLSRLIN